MQHFIYTQIYKIKTHGVLCVFVRDVSLSVFPHEEDVSATDKPTINSPKRTTIRETNGPPAMKNTNIPQSG